MAPIRVFVVDDEAPARKKIVRFLGRDPDVVITGEAANGPQAVQGIRQTQPDLLYIDVQMPGMDGFEVVRSIEPGPMPRIIFVTAHDQYAIQAFELHAFGYLLKPFDEERFTRVLNDAKQHLEQERKDNVEREVTASLKLLLAEVEQRKQKPARLLIEQDGRAFFLASEKIDWAEADRNYLKIHSGDQAYSIRGTLESLEEKLDAAQFVRLNRSCLVRIEFIRELQSWFHGEYKVVLKSGDTLTWTRRYLNRHPELLQKL